MPLETVLHKMKPIGFPCMLRAIGAQLPGVTVDGQSELTAHATFRNDRRNPLVFPRVQHCFQGARLWTRGSGRTMRHKEASHGESRDRQAERRRNHDRPPTAA